MRGEQDETREQTWPGQARPDGRTARKRGVMAAEGKTVFKEVKGTGSHWQFREDDNSVIAMESGNKAITADLGESHSSGHTAWPQQIRVGGEASPQHRAEK